MAWYKNGDMPFTEPHLFLGVNAFLVAVGHLRCRLELLDPDPSWGVDRETFLPGVLAVAGWQSVGRRG